MAHISAHHPQLKGKSIFCRLCHLSISCTCIISHIHVTNNAQGMMGHNTSMAYIFSDAFEAQPSWEFMLNPFEFGICHVAKGPVLTAGKTFQALCSLFPLVWVWGFHSTSFQVAKHSTVASTEWEGSGWNELYIDDEHMCLHVEVYLWGPLSGLILPLLSTCQWH